MGTLFPAGCQTSRSECEWRPLPLTGQTQANRDQVWQTAADANARQQRVLQAVKATDEDELRPLRETVAGIERGLGGLVLEEPAAPRWDEEIAAALSGFTQKLYRVLEQRLAVRMAACERPKDLRIRVAGLFGCNPRGATARPVCSASGALAQTAWVSASSSFRCASPGVTRLGKFDWTSCTFGALLCVFPGLSL